jgi:polyhydroxyalkanoate synthase
MMGEAPPAFDLLYWNGDGTNLPARMAVDYLRGLCQDDGFALGKFKVFGKPVSLGDIKLPLCAIACETDHIAHWRGSFNSVRQMGAKNKTFILSESGHIAGIINPPSKNKYGHYTNDAPVDGPPEAWLKSATFNQGSWWPRWKDWLAGHSGPLVKARKPVDSLCPAPGTYVTAVPGD